MRDAMKGFGFDCVIYGATRSRVAGTIGSKAETYFISNLPDRFMSLFWDQELYRTTPIAVWSLTHTGTKSLQDFGDLYRAGAFTPEEARSQEMLTEAGVTSGYVMGFSDDQTPISAAIALLNFGIDFDEAAILWEKHGSEIQLYAQIFQLKANALPMPLEGKRLTARQREVLQWVAAGKTSAEAAVILGITPATVEKHLRQIRDTLGVSTTTQAVLHAELYSQIFSGKWSGFP